MMAGTGQRRTTEAQMDNEMTESGQVLANEDFGEFARDLSRATSEDEVLQLGVQHAVQLVGGCDHAGVTIVERTTVSTAAATDDVVKRGDQLQYDLNEGPCLDSVRDHELVVSHDLLTDQRWPRWSPRVVEETGVRAMVALLLFTHTRAYGALNLYADQPGAYDHEDIAAAQALAAHLAVAVAAGREIDHLGIALTNRTVIGQAEGILMERYGITSDQAFNYLRRTSQEQNRKLAALAADLVRTRQLPAAPPRED